MKIEILNILVLRDNKGPDILLLKTELPEGQFPFSSNTSLRLDVGSNMAERYIEENLTGIPYTVKNI